MAGYGIWNTRPLLSGTLGGAGGSMWGKPPAAPQPMTAAAMPQPGPMMPAVMPQQDPLSSTMMAGPPVGGEQQLPSSGGVMGQQIEAPALPAMPIPPAMMPADTNATPGAAGLMGSGALDPKKLWMMLSRTMGGLKS